MSGTLGIDGERTAMHEQTFHKHKEQLDDERLVYEPEATSRGGSIYAEIHSRSEGNVESIETQRVVSQTCSMENGITPTFDWRCQHT
jgi:hypothetical protein